MFKIDGKFYQYAGTIADLIMLSIIHLICCIPVITIGVATTALYSTCLKMTDGKEGYILKTYFKQFGSNFKKSTLIWIIMFALGAFMYVDLRIIATGMGDTPVSNFLRAFFLVSIVAIIGISIYAFALQGKFENTIKNTIKNAAMLALAKLPWTAAMLVITLLPIILSSIFPEQTYTVLFGTVVFWMAAGVYLNAFMLRRIFGQLMEQDEE